MIITRGSLLACLASTITSVMGFTHVPVPSTSVRSAPSSSSSALQVAVDPTTVTKKEYQDICGVEFDDERLMKRLKATNYLYPKHVEVIEDIAPIAGEMVDEIVSFIR